MFTVGVASEKDSIDDIGFVPVTGERAGTASPAAEPRMADDVQEKNRSQRLGG